MKSKKQNKKNQLELDFKSDIKDSVKSIKPDGGKIIYLGKYANHREGDLIDKIISLSDHIK